MMVFYVIVNKRLNSDEGSPLLAHFAFDLLCLGAGPSARSGLVPVRPELVAGFRYFGRYRSSATRNGDERRHHHAGRDAGQGHDDAGSGMSPL
jgi:hypothetical protein